ncbi:MAG: MotA/TolQ/ExbB proton channel family protein [Pirellulales bacterium]|nr:MotA/TolQ/ExbB proton channel family protein [Pirellulales bacterium]
MDEPQVTQRKPSRKLPFDLSMILAAGLTVAFYVAVEREPLRHTVLYRYTTEHAVEYVVVGFFIWGLADLLLRALNLPREHMALRHDWLPARQGLRPASEAAALLETVQSQPSWLLESRMGQRLSRALKFVADKRSAADFDQYLRSLADEDEDRTHAHYGLARLVCWVMPVLGFLGTVVHFGTALSGISFDKINEQLSSVVGQMGTAFNTTTAAIACSIATMLVLFLCERAEREQVRAVDRLVEEELLHRFEVADASMAPYLDSLNATGKALFATIGDLSQQQQAAMTRALTAWQQQAEQRLQQQHELWEQSHARLQEQLEARETASEARLAQLLAAVEQRRDEQQAQSLIAARQLAEVRDGLARLTDSLVELSRNDGRMTELQATLADNLRVLRESNQLEEAMHSLTAAIHLMTAPYRNSAAPPTTRSKKNAA